MNKIKKRDGRIVDFDDIKIANAIVKVVKQVEKKETLSYEELREVASLSTNVLIELKKDFDDNIPSVEDVQDAVENVLFKKGCIKELKAYSKYRNERTKLREKDSKLMNIFKEIVSSDAIDSDMKRDNGNVNGDSTMGAMLKFGSEASKYYTILELLKPEHAKAHQSGDIHIHDLDFYALGTTTCCQIPLGKMLKDGFNTGHGHLREPNSIGSYSALACIVLQSNQGEQYGRI